MNNLMNEGFSNVFDSSTIDLADRFEKSDISYIEKTVYEWLIEHFDNEIVRRLNKDEIKNEIKKCFTIKIENEIPYLYCSDYIKDEQGQVELIFGFKNSSPDIIEVPFVIKDDPTISGFYVYLHPTSLNFNRKKLKDLRFIGDIKPDKLKFGTFDICADNLSWVPSAWKIESYDNNEFIVNEYLNIWKNTDFIFSEKEHRGDKYEIYYGHDYESNKYGLIDLYISKNSAQPTYESIFKNILENINSSIITNEDFIHIRLNGNINDKMTFKSGVNLFKINGKKVLIAYSKHRDSWRVGGQWDGYTHYENIEMPFILENGELKFIKIDRENNKILSDAEINPVKKLLGESFSNIFDSSGIDYASYFEDKDRKELLNKFTDLYVKTAKKHWQVLKKTESNDWLEDCKESAKKMKITLDEWLYKKYNAGFGACSYDAFNILYDVTNYCIKILHKNNYNTIKNWNILLNEIYQELTSFTRDLYPKYRYWNKFYGDFNKLCDVLNEWFNYLLEEYPEFKYFLNVNESFSNVFDSSGVDYASHFEEKDIWYKNSLPIKEWLDKYNIQNYTINKDLTVDVDGDVNLAYNGSNGYTVNLNTGIEDWTYKGLLKIEVQFNKVSGHFRCDHNQLSSLKGCPKEVVGDFRCNYNRLTSLEGCPKEISGSFLCDHNQLTSLEGCPEKVGAMFTCDHNQLSSLEGCPKKVGGSFLCDYNHLSSAWTEEKLRLISNISGDIYGLDNQYRINEGFSNVFDSSGVDYATHFEEKDSKYLREKPIRDWLHAMRLDEYHDDYYLPDNSNLKFPKFTINPDLTIDGDGYIDLESYNLDKVGIPKYIQFRKVNGDFHVGFWDNISNPKLNPGCLTRGALGFGPKEVTGNYSICYCNGEYGLYNLKGCPEKVGGTFNCMQNYINTFKWLPKEVGKDFICTCNGIELFSRLSPEIYKETFPNHKPCEEWTPRKLREAIKIGGKVEPGNYMNFPPEEM